jgi:hypothetical protein
MRLLVVALLITAGLFFFYKEQFRRVLDDLTDVRQIKATEDEAFVAAGGKVEPAKTPPIAAPGAATPAKAKNPPVPAPPAVEAKKPTIAPLGAPKRYELPGTEPDRK